MEIWDTAGLGFGDIWATLHLLLRKSEAKKAPVYVTQWCDGRHDISHRVREMLALIETPPGVSVEVVDAVANSKVHMEMWGSPYFPTRMQWSPQRSGIVTYQFDGKSSAHAKNPTPQEVKDFFSWTVDSGLQPVAVGSHLSMSECVRLMAGSEFFVGVCSGMATLAHSVGVPTYILEYELKVAWWHGSNPITVCQGVRDLIAKAPLR